MTIGSAVAALSLAACAAVDTTSAERFSATGEVIALSGASAGAANACFTCHGLDGAGDGAGTPRLAGLDSGYLERQLNAYADGRRDHLQMAWIAQRLGPTERRAVASHYAGLPFAGTSRRAGPGGEQLYRRGDAVRGIPACASCHGGNGEGIGPANPPLAGQPAHYIAGQLDAWRQSRRRNDPDDVMLAISQRLSPAERAAVARYASALPGGPPRPESAEALRSAHRAATRSDAPAPPRHVPEAARAAQ